MMMMMMMIFCEINPRNGIMTIFHPGVFVFFPWVVVLVFVFGDCSAVFLFLLAAAVGMCPSASAASA